MPNHFLRVLSTVCVLCICLCSCSLVVIEQDGTHADRTPSTTGVGATTDTPYTSPDRPDAAETAASALAALPDADFTGLSLIVASAGYNPLFPTAGERADDRAKLARNAAVSERYGVTFIPAASDVDTIYAETLAAKNSGMYYADILVLPANQVGRFAAAGLLRNLNNLPFWSNTTDAYGADAAQGGANHAIYADLGAAMLDHDRLPAILFNRTLAESLGYDLYAAVESGTWTWELYLQAAADAAALDGVSGHGISPTDTNRYSDLLAGSTGLHLVDNTEGQTPTLTLPENLAEIDTLLRRLRGDNSGFTGQAGNEIAALQSFAEGKLLFCCTNLEYVDWLYDSGAEWGVLPLPGSGDGSYHTPTGASAPVLCVTENNNKFEQTGLIVAALNAASIDVITDAYITDRLQNRLRDWESAAMIELIADSASYDLPVLYASGMPSLASAAIASVRDAAAGGYPLATLVQARSYYANLELSRLFG